MNLGMRKCDWCSHEEVITVPQLEISGRRDCDVLGSASLPNVLRSLKLTFPDQDVHTLEVLAQDLCRPSD